VTIAALKPYPTMKDSGVPWLGAIPVHWSSRRLKTVFREVDERSKTGTETLLSLRMEHGLVDHHGTGGKPIPAEALVGYKRTEPGEIVMNRMRAAAGLFAAAPCAGIVSPDYAVLRPIVPVELGYYVRPFRSPHMMSVSRLESRGLGTGESGFLRLYTERFGMLASLVPPLPEQAAIVKFLDRADRQIRRYIRAKQRLIKLLEEQKQAIIHRAVTRGLDPNVRLKPSGVGWLGEVPEHWEVMPLRRAAISRCDGPFGSGLKSSHYTDYGIRVVRLQNIGHAEFKDADAAFIASAYNATLGDHGVEGGALLVAGLGDERHPAGRACVAPPWIAPAMVKADCFRFRLLRKRLDPEFAALHLTATASDASSLLSTGATRQRTNLQATASRSITVPPIDEQLAIQQHIQTATASSRRGIRAAEREIELLRQYRTRLIAEVVTGKLDVREAAAALADEADEPFDDTAAA
jgi:type I restriction enzyme S subunit